MKYLPFLVILASFCFSQSSLSDIIEPREIVLESQLLKEPLASSNQWFSIEMSYFVKEG